MVREIKQRVLKLYVDGKGKAPFSEWLKSLKDAVARNRIRARLDRLELGNFGDCESVGSGVYELRMFFGSGYRVYLAEDGDTIIILLSGGDKDSQNRDIKKAKEYWQDYLKR